MEPSLTSPRRPRPPRARASLLPSPLVLLALAAPILLLNFPRPASAQDDDASCYFPNGTQTGSDVMPCGGGGDDSAHSHCCHQGWACLSNGLCMRAGDDPSELASASILQGGCTDDGWTSPDCPRFCVDDEEIDDLGRSQPIEACQGSDSTFYCVLSGEDADCDDDDDDVFQLDASATVMTTVGASSSSSASASSASASSASSASSAEASATSDPDSGSGPDDSGGSDSGDDGGSGGGGDNSLGIGLGLGVGIGVGGLGIILAGVFFWLWRRRVRKAKAAEEDGDGLDAAAGDKHDGDPPAYGSELPANRSADLREAPPDSMRVEAPQGDGRVGRAEVPDDEKKYEAPVSEGTSGRHELVGSEVVGEAGAGAGAEAAVGGEKEAGTGTGTAPETAREIPTVVVTGGSEVGSPTTSPASPGSPGAIPRKPLPQ